MFGNCAIMPTAGIPSSNYEKAFRQVQQNIELSENVQTLLNQVLAEFFRDVNGLITVDPLEGGHSTNGVISLLIDKGDKKYVLRVKANESSEQALKCEHYAMSEGARQQISPKVYFSTDDRRAILMEFVDANTLTVAEAQKPINCERIAKTIRKAHEAPRNPFFCDSSEDDVVEGIFEDLKQSPKLTETVNQAIEIMRNCNAKLSHYDSCFVNNHGDLNSRNMFLTVNDPMLIDWEYTNWADLFEDLSYFCLRHNYDDDLEKHFLESYLEHFPSENELEKYYLFKKKTFAQLCIYFHYFSLKFNPEGIAFSSSSKTWKEHMIAYSERRDEMPPVQFYFELANEALVQAKALGLNSVTL